MVKGQGEAEERAKLPPKDRGLGFRGLVFGCGKMKSRGSSLKFDFH